MSSCDQAGESDRKRNLLSQQRQHFWIRALENLGHQVQLFFYTDDTSLSRPLRFAMGIEARTGFPGTTIVRRKIQSFQNNQIQARLVQLASQIHPDLIMLSDIWATIDSSLMLQLKRVSDSKIAFLNGTSPNMTASERFKTAVRYFDFVFCNDFYHALQWHELGAAAVHALPISACDPKTHRVTYISETERSELSSDVAFIGQVGNQRFYRERIEMLEALTDFDLGVWSDDNAFLEEHPLLKENYRGRAHGTKAAKVLSATKIAVNFHGQTMLSGGNMRTFEIPAAGAFQIVDRYNPEWFEEGKEIVSFNSVDDLRAKVRYYLEHEDERKAITAAGQDRTYRDHTYEKRMQQLIAIVTGETP